MPINSGPDEGLAALKLIKVEFATFLATGGATEADTRSQLIDRILTQVLFWPNSDIRRETFTGRGFSDYILWVNNRSHIVVEAKREGVPFRLPDEIHLRLKVSGALKTAADVCEAVDQVRSYCEDTATRYAVATNGYSWILFRALRDDIPWKDGHTTIFPNLDYIERNFREFWALLSYQQICAGSLDKEFGALRRNDRRLNRVIGQLFDADVPLERNRYHAQLSPIINSFFQDIADSEQIEILQKCYVHSQSLKVVTDDLNHTIQDSIPNFLIHEGATEVKVGEADAGELGKELTSRIAPSKGQLYLLLGGIGCGKTTFLKRFLRTVAAEYLEKYCLHFYVDFLSPPADPTRIEPFVWEQILAQIRGRYKDQSLERRKNVRKAFAQEIEALKETALRGLQPGSPDYEQILGIHLDKWQSDTSLYAARLLSTCREQGKALLVFIDNVDQLSPDYQSRIFLFSQKLTSDIKSRTVVSLREESYYTASLQKVFTAYSNRKFHIASPKFLALIHNRLDYARQILKKNKTEVQSLLNTVIDLDLRALIDLLTILQESLTSKRRVVLFIESVCFGNMRLALEMFGVFLLSGVTDVDKMLGIYRREKRYIIAFHEMLKSVMLEDRKYYKESESPIMNVFDVGADANASHFTSLRILNLLMNHRWVGVREGQGYFDVSKLFSMFEDAFNNTEDVGRSLNRLVSKQLVETNSRSTETISDASHVRITSAGWYFLNYLVKDFTYLDLVLQDTPLDDPALEQSLRKSVHDVDNLYGNDKERVRRLDVRFKRVDDFLNYLLAQEQQEVNQKGLDRTSPILAAFVPSILSSYELEKDTIMGKLKSRDRYQQEEHAALESAKSVGILLEEENGPAS